MLSFGTIDRGLEYLSISNKLLYKHFRPNTEGHRFASSWSPPETSAQCSTFVTFACISIVNLGCRRFAMTVSLSLSFSRTTSDTHLGVDITLENGQIGKCLRNKNMHLVKPTPTCISEHALYNICTHLQPLP
mmetsp:Transcript_6645/g.20858  ORF Transcript_6645/g.20858 Transcript_6645/m.20858 type:complete len:132 (-) Transcript_6645:32-427(-)